jgi:hypothetical protein
MIKIVEVDVLINQAGADGVGVPTGGTTGQVLKKNSNTNHDTVWQDETGGGGGSDENYTTAEKNKLASITAIFTTALETAYNSAVTWISTNGTNLLNHLGLTNNPHSVTKTQVGLGNVDNTSDVNKPVSTAQQTALDLKMSKSVYDPDNRATSYYLKYSEVLNNGSNITLNSTHSDNTVLITQGGSATNINVQIWTSTTKTTVKIYNATIYNLTIKDMLSNDIVTLIYGESLIVYWQNSIYNYIHEDYNSQKQSTLISGSNIKTINSTSILGPGNLLIDKNSIGLGNVPNLDTSTTANITDSANKRYVTDANLTLIANTSGANTGDNATNSQYSGLASSKQDTLVSATNIKTINTASLLGSGNINLGEIPRKSGLYYYPTGSTGVSFGTITLNRLFAQRFDVGTVGQTFDRIGIGCLASAGSFLRLGVYSDTNGFPDALITDFGQLNTAVAGANLLTISQSLSGVVWIVGVGQSVAPSVSRRNLFEDSSIAGGDPYSQGASIGYYIDSITGGLPSSWGSNVNYIYQAYVAPKIILRKA